VVALPPVVVTDFDVVVVGATAGAGITTVCDAGGVAAAGGGDGALRWITMVRCFTMGFKGLDAFTEIGADATVDAEDVPIPQWNVTAAAPAMKDAASPPAVSTADRLFLIARSFLRSLRR
jgi:hypothetical protein